MLFRWRASAFARRPQGQHRCDGGSRNSSRKISALTPDQVAQIDAIFQATLPELRHRKDELDRLESKLSHLIERDTDEAVIASQVDKTEAARGALNKMRTLMLMRMRQVLRPDQRVRFKALHERWDRERQLQAARRQQDAR